MVYPNDVAIDYESRKLYVFSDNLPKFEHSNLSEKESNYFITVASLDSLAKHCKAYWSMIQTKLK